MSKNTVATINLHHVKTRDVKVSRLGEGKGGFISIGFGNTGGSSVSLFIGDGDKDEQIAELRLLAHKLMMSANELDQ